MKLAHLMDGHPVAGTDWQYWLDEETDTVYRWNMLADSTAAWQREVTGHSNVYQWRFSSNLGDVTEAELDQARANTPVVTSRR